MEVPAPQLAGASVYHLFLSHRWGTGQDQMRILKQRLMELIPELRIFLDVDDLREGRGAESVDESQVAISRLARRAPSRVLRAPPRMAF